MFSKRHRALTNEPQLPVELSAIAMAEARATVEELTRKHAPGLETYLAESARSRVHERLSLEAAPTKVPELLFIQGKLEKVFGRGNVAIVGSVALNLNRITMASHAINPIEVIRPGSDVDFVVAGINPSRLSRPSSKNQKVTINLNDEGFEANKPINGPFIDDYDGSKFYVRCSDMAEGFKLNGTDIHIIPKLFNIPSKTVVNNSFTETYTNFGSQPAHLTYATIPFLVLTKAEPSGNIRREQDVEVVRGILDTYYDGSVATFMEQERDAVKSVSRYINHGSFHLGLLESLLRTS